MAVFKSMALYTRLFGTVALHYILLQFSSFMVSVHRVPVRPFRPLSQNILLHLSSASLWKLLHDLYLTRYHEFTNGALVFRPFDYFLPN